VTDPPAAPRFLSTERVRVVLLVALAAFFLVSAVVEVTGAIEDWPPEGAYLVGTVGLAGALLLRLRE
jgi:uncharacterized membrane protein HdeD (DUF308 family)